jgi:hypothetical protein
MNPFLHAVTVAKQRVQEIDARYDGYHAELIKKLVEIISKQEEGLSDQKRRREVADIITSFGSAVASKRDD